MSDYDKQAEEYILAEVRMISGCHDTQTSADVSNVGSFNLPDPQGRAGGACTAALLQVLYQDDHTVRNLSWVDLLREMRYNLDNQGYSQVPQLTSSRLIDVQNTFNLINPLEASYGGVRRAVLIGINYVGQQGQLSGCHNDVRNMKKFLQEVHGFEDHNITVLMDDNIHIQPSRHNILNAYRKAVESTLPGDTLFCHYSGHGGRVRDTSGDEDDGYDETLIPVDFQSAGHIVDDQLLECLVKPLPKGAVMTCLMDCCHSGTVLDLPYRFTADGDVQEGMTRNDGFGGFDVLDAVAICCCIDLFYTIMATGLADLF
mmetsp:Transcript_18489/g.26030  ORF Transcript_18489/g.26030 Transcript_18489/m.26030 type:complete len:315 (+) Transcript_18489:168-1112(+)|eukprot:CAMPEP_0184859722 /NCGR_PEP_ID=MMETSP0580-20130426/4708_1 /TAXON_ID=1118495 /ORGANISM="Dactyliosolen fragilissimus" /LENGTH=314 /DNA_ID=CAMNT_0027356517 /DNA_START=93 /DNA_END=1037 /DNA_ORIENTATION=+